MQFKNILVSLRNIGRHIILTTLSLHWLLRPGIMRIELLSWALCNKPKRYRTGNYFFEKKGLLDTHCYGETPLFTLNRIARRAHINSQSRVLEMGSGAGKAAIYLAETTGCNVIGVETNPQLLAFANRLASGCRIADQVSFIEADMLTLPPQDVDTIYIYHSALDDHTITAMAQNLGFYGPEVSIITVSYALEEVFPEGFVTEQCFDGWFPWGITWVYIQRPTGKLLTALAQRSRSELVQ